MNQEFITAVESVLEKRGIVPEDIEFSDETVYFKDSKTHCEFALILSVLPEPETDKEMYDDELYFMQIGS
jgi:hypothetical protein